MSVLVRAAGDPHAIAPDVRRAVQRLDPEVPIFEIRTLDEIAFDRLGTRRFAMSLFGVFAPLAASRLLVTLLYEVSTVDPLTYVAVALVLGAVCVAAAYLPALRATRVDPLTSIRSE